MKILSNGKGGMCFFFNEKLYSGMEVEYSMDKEPFIKIKVINNYRK